MRAEAQRPVTALPKAKLDNRESEALALKLRRSELRYRRALNQAVSHSDKQAALYRRKQKK